MALSRRALFGFPPPQAPSSTYTVRMVPLTQGVNQDTAWPLLPPGSATSMTNFLPLDGVLRPRSRLSSINTLDFQRALGSGMYELVYGTGAADVWSSGATMHAIVRSTGSISVASFVSAFGIGVASLQQQLGYQYTQAFMADLSTGENVVVAAGMDSQDTLLCLYTAGANGAGAVQYSYLTSAPKALAVDAFDNYLIALNIDNGGPFLSNRVQWCVRGEPSNWTGEGSGFEDLLEMRGKGIAVKGLSDGRIVLFTDHEIWYGLRAAYPAQFQFYPLDTAVGCPYARTIQETSDGLIFVGSDFNVRFLPHGGGASRILVPQLGSELRLRHADVKTNSWALYDPFTRLYHLFVEKEGADQIDGGYIVNPLTGEWGYLRYSTDYAPYAGVALGEGRVDAFAPTEGTLLASGTNVFSTSSLKSHDSGLPGSGSVVTSTWQSPPIAADLPGNWKQLLDVNVDYRATSRSTLTLRIAADGNTYETTGRALSLASAPIAGRAKSEVYAGGAFPTVEIVSTSTGYELHRLDVTMNLGGRRA